MLVVSFGVGSRCSSWAPWSLTVGSWLGLARSLAVAFGVGYSRTLLEKRSVVSEGSIRASSCWGVRAGAAGVRAVELLGLWAVRAVSGRGVGPSGRCPGCAGFALVRVSVFRGCPGCPGFSCLSGLVVSGLSGLSPVVGWAGLSGVSGLSGLSPVVGWAGLSGLSGL